MGINSNRWMFAAVLMRRVVEGLHYCDIFKFFVRCFDAESEIGARNCMLRHIKTVTCSAQVDMLYALCLSHGGVLRCFVLRCFDAVLCYVVVTFLDVPFCG